MPANLTPEYMKAEQEYRRASTPEDKLSCLRHMLSVIPKHKGTDKLQGDLKHRIARLKEAVDRGSRKKGPSYRVRPEGAGQIMLVGSPNSGKSALLGAMSHAEPEVADYPCTTREPVPGMVEFEGVQIQLVDLPPVWREHCESFVFDNIKACDAVLLVADLSSPDPAENVREILAFLGEKHVSLVPARAEESAAELGRETVEYQLVLTKADLDPDGDVAAVVTRELGGEIPVRVVSVNTGKGLDALPGDMFRLLRVIRVYSKEPGGPADHTSPFAVPIGCTVFEFAGHVHHDFAEQFKSARVWGSSKFDGQTVERNFVLQDRDIVELSMK
ncbi:MAG: 50S ribosome-binding GTPase [Lentisphaerae bacterium]|nr:50S ribosome-binding GTPase [Lentisphaerota bacterium]